MLLSLITAITIALSAINPAPADSGCVSHDAAPRWVEYEQTGYVHPDGSPVMGWCWTGGGYYHSGSPPDYTPPVVERKPIGFVPVTRGLPCHYPGWVNMDADDPQILVGLETGL